MGVLDLKVGAWGLGCRVWLGLASDSGSQKGRSSNYFQFARRL